MNRVIINYIFSKGVLYYMKTNGYCKYLKPSTALRLALDINI